ncbi:neuronal acetylcholine receptor subunit alpha-7-like [Acanthaster planci]|uniref:Neuronal acetylcholine receptor subunit alpha-7-like n=1 Tax=Acanthaster planci TaxID=133434 RepID=A0A8B7XQ70_ACAPL|nr:neuronal acetylcholine receptor subunit alpha-7-like [Acanthaster planci]
MSFDFSWRDEFLVWNPGDYNGQTELRTLRPNIWKPNLVVLENVNSNFAVHDNTEISITSNGTVNWYAPVIYQTACKVNVRQFPFDVQHCNLSFLSWTFDQSRLELWYFDDEDAKQEVFSGDGVWHLVDVAAERKDVFWACCEQPFSIVVYTLTFERSSLFYTFSILIPSVLLTTITLALFWMPAESGEKISLGMTNLLAFVLFQQLIADSMPPLGDQTPIITIYLFCMVVVGCASIYVAVYVLRLYHTPSDKPVPQGVVNVVKCLSRQKAPVTWQAVSRIIDKGMFAVFLVSSVVIMVTSFIAVKHGA